MSTTMLVAVVDASLVGAFGGAWGTTFTAAPLVLSSETSLSSTALVAKT